MDTLVELFERGTSRPRDRHLLWRDEAGEWQGLSTAEVIAAVDSLARALAARGLAVGERVGLLCRNHPRWAIADHAILRAGLVNVPLYPTLTPEQVRFILADCGARFLLVEDAEQERRLRPALEGLDLLGVGVLHGEPDAGVSWEALVAEGRGAPELERRPDPEDLASIIYTSGTTGRPKGAMLTHANLVANVEQCAGAIDLTREQQVNLSLLPLCHVFQRLVDYFLFSHHATMAYCPDPLAAVEYMGEVRPTFFASVPRLYEKVKAGFEAKVAAAPARKRRLAEWALGVGRRHFHAWYRDGACDGSPSPWLSLLRATADVLVLSKVRRVFGGRVAICFSGGAALPGEVHEFYRAVGLNLLPGYGLTEASPVLATNREERMKLGSVGPALPGLSLKLAADSELLAAGPNVMQGYWNLAEETAACIEDGWLHTGDLASIDEHGYVSITGRKKEIFVLSTGKKVAPQLVEDRFARCPWVSQAMLVGDGEKFVAALVHPALERLAAAARERGIAFEAPEDLLESEEAEALVLEGLREHCADLSDFERPKRVVFLPAELTQEAGELTPTLKLRRREILERHAERIARVYGAKETR